MAKSAAPLLLLGGAAVLLLGGKKKKKRKSFPSADHEASAMFAKFAAETGNDDFNPKFKPLKSIIIEFQMIMGLSRVDGVFDNETKSALDEAIKSHSTG